MTPNVFDASNIAGYTGKSWSNAEKVQIIYPIYKKGSNNDVGNFMPICLTSVVGK